VDGRAWHDREGDVQPAEFNVPLLAGDRIRTERGRVEVLFADGSVLDIDEGTDAELLSESLLRLNTGTIRLQLTRSNVPVDYRVDSGGASVWIQAAGDYRIASRGPGADVRLMVRRGLAELASPFGRSLVQAGMAATTTDRTTPSFPYAVNTSTFDPFDRWVEARATERLGNPYAVAASYLPEEIGYYGGTLSRYGVWESHPSHGYVWYPRVVADWRPYYDGHWSFVGSFGWFWIGATNWSWPTHHYGRWGTHYGRWYWVPDRRWGPAWVSWASAPGYVGWCPLGYNNRPIYPLSVRSYDTWRGWTVLPSKSFATDVYVRRAAVNGRTAVPRNVHFVERTQAPVRPSSLRTNQAPLRSPSSYASTRYAQPRENRVWSDRQTTTAPRQHVEPVTRDRGVPTRRTADTPAADSRSRTVTRSATTSSTRVLRTPTETDRPQEDGRSSTPPRTRIAVASGGESGREAVAPPTSTPWGSATRQTTRRAPADDGRNGAPAAASVPRSSAPERGVENRTVPRPQRMEPRSSVPERSPQADRPRGERSVPERAAPSRSGPDPRQGGSEGHVRSRGADPAPAAPGASTGRQAPEGSQNGGTARGRSR
jgi:hypothetical protein